MLIGNKCDIAESARTVSTEEGQEFANKNGLTFLETSAKTAENVDRLFEESATIIYDLLESQAGNGIPQTMTTDLNHHSL